MKTMKRLMGSVIGVWLMASCGQVAHVQKDDSVDFTKIRTYAWVYGTRKDTLSQKTGVNDLIDRKIRSSIDRNLRKNGWMLVNRKPDVLLVYDVDIQRENRTVSDPVYSMPVTRWFFSPYNRRYVPVYYPSQFIGFDDHRESYKEGTITLTLMNANSEKTIWQGWASTEINGKRMTDKEIESNVKAIVKKLG